MCGSAARFRQRDATNTWAAPETRGTAQELTMRLTEGHRPSAHRTAEPHPCITFKPTGFLPSLSQPRLIGAYYLPNLDAFNVTSAFAQAFLKRVSTSAASSFFPSAFNACIKPNSDQPFSL